MRMYLTTCLKKNSMVLMSILARRCFVIFALFAGACLAGCAAQNGAPDDSMSSYMVSPGKYQLYNCAQMAALEPPLRTREGELIVLIAKAESGPGGAFAATLAYRSEYLQVRGELAELGRAAAAKNCPPPAVEEAPRPPKTPPKGRPTRL